MSSITIVPRKFVKPYLRPKRRLQREVHAKIQQISKTLKVPFAFDAAQALEIAERGRGFRVGDVIGRRTDTAFAPHRVWRPNQSQLKAA